MILGLALAVVATLPDPRPEIAELVLRGASDVALERIDRALGEDRAGSERNGLDYLRGDQLDRLGRREQAMEQFVAALGSERLAARARLRLARLRFEAEEPTVAAGLIASLVSPGVDRGTRSEAIDLFLRSLEAGGDCRLLAGVRSDRFRGSERRELELARGECAEREQDDATAAALATRLLEQATDDALAREAAELLARTTLAEGRDRRQRLLLARTAYAHREFELARTLFLEVLGGSATSSREWDDGYALARSEFWLAEHDAAAERFAALARAATSGRDRANALFQAGRSSELAGRWDEASRHFEAARGAEPLGGWAGAAQLAALRLAALSGDEAAAEGLLRSLASRRSWRQELARGAFFLASGRLARGESEGTAAWLERARQSGVAGAEELAYWEGRRAELEGSHARAVDAYVEAVTSDPFHPFARLAAERLRSATLAPAARARGFALASGNSIADLRSAALLLGSDDPLGAKTRVEARARVARLPGGGVWLDWSPVPPVEWSVYRSPPKDAGDLLVALGRLDEAPGVVSRWFPAADTRVAFTGAAALAAAGGTDRRSLEPRASSRGCRQPFRSTGSTPTCAASSIPSPSPRASGSSRRCAASIRTSSRRSCARRAASTRRPSPRRRRWGSPSSSIRRRGAWRATSASRSRCPETCVARRSRSPWGRATSRSWRGVSAGGSPRSSLPTTRARRRPSSGCVTVLLRTRRNSSPRWAFGRRAPISGGSCAAAPTMRRSRGARGRRPACRPP